MKKIIYILFLLSLVTAKEKFKKGSNSTGFNLNQIDFYSTSTKATVEAGNESTLNVSSKTKLFEINGYHSYYFRDYINAKFLIDITRSSNFNGFSWGIGMEYILDLDTLDYDVLNHIPIHSVFSLDYIYETGKQDDREISGYNFVVSAGGLYSINQSFSAKFTLNFIILANYDYTVIGQSNDEINKDGFFMDFGVQYDY